MGNGKLHLRGWPVALDFSSRGIGKTDRSVIQYADALASSHGGKDGSPDLRDDARIIELAVFLQGKVRHC